jgi:hypothetical protein
LPWRRETDVAESLFHAISRAVHEPSQLNASIASGTGSPKKLTLAQLAQAVFQNANVELDGYEATVVRELYEGLVQSNYINQFEDIMGFLNFEKDCSCTLELLMELLLEKLKLRKWIPQNPEGKLEVLLQRYRLDERDRMVA